MSQLPTWWYRTEHFWIGVSLSHFNPILPSIKSPVLMFLAWHSTDYPHTLIPSELKRYYLMQTAYWMQQFLVLVLGLEKPRKDYAELVAHHVVTLFLVMCVSFLSIFKRY